MTKIRETKVHGAYVVCVPPSVRVALDLGKGDYVEWYLENYEALQKILSQPFSNQAECENIIAQAHAWLINRGTTIILKKKVEK